MRRVFAVALIMVVCGGADAPKPKVVRRRPSNAWLRKEPLGETPKRTTDSYPLSDQENKGQWVKFEALSDEFDGKELDLAKWMPRSTSSNGHKPGLFREENVAVADGKLRLTMRKEKVPPQYEKQGYHDYTCAVARSTTKVLYGYFEVRAKVMNSGGSSAFWFAGSGDGWRTEIDVYEISGNGKGFEQKYNMHLHVFYTPTEQVHWQVGDVWVAPWRLADDHHVYGLDWAEKQITYYVDGVAVWRLDNTHWHQPLSLILDCETLMEWFGLPEDEDLPSTHSIDYVRAWKGQP
jgi:beta-glucanase (GH16 family)